METDYIRTTFLDEYRQYRKRMKQHYACRDFTDVFRATEVTEGTVGQYVVGDDAVQG